MGWERPEALDLGSVHTLHPFPVLITDTNLLRSLVCPPGGRGCVSVCIHACHAWSGVETSGATCPQSWCL